MQATCPKCHSVKVHPPGVLIDRWTTHVCTLCGYVWNSDTRVSKSCINAYRQRSISKRKPPVTSEWSQCPYRFMRAVGATSGFITAIKSIAERLDRDTLGDITVKDVQEAISTHGLRKDSKPHKVKARVVAELRLVYGYTPEQVSQYLCLDRSTILKMLKDYRHMFQEVNQ